MLERIATGVVSIGADGRIETINSAALRLLDVDRARRRHAGRGRLRARGSAAARHAAAPGAQRRADTGRPQEIALVREGRELHLAAAATPLQGEDGSVEGAVLVFDDVTPLIRTQRVAAWRDVARRLAHEIKNPLTPIQLCAERMRRHFATAPPPARDAGRGVHVDDRRRGRIAQGAGRRVRAVRADAGAEGRARRICTAVLTDALALYNGLFRNIRIERRFDEALPPVRVDVEQIRRVVINLVDNAVEALGGSRRARRGRTARRRRSWSRPGTIERNGVARIVVADNGPGIPAADRDKLFMPYYSTKRRGSGLGLAIVRRIIVEHGGSIEVPTTSRRNRFVIELPL